MARGSYHVLIYIFGKRGNIIVVHQFKNNGYDIVLDVNSGAIHVVDDVMYDVIAFFEEHTEEEIFAALSGRYPQEEPASRQRGTVHGGCL
jgi:hypothetical protein